MRKRQAVKRDVLADPIYNSKVVTKLINRMMIGGKRGKAEKILYDAFDIINSAYINNNGTIQELRTELEDVWEYMNWS